MAEVLAGLAVHDDLASRLPGEVDEGDVGRFALRDGDRRPEEKAEPDERGAARLTE